MSTTGPPKSARAFLVDHPDPTTAYPMTKGDLSTYTCTAHWCQPALGAVSTAAPSTVQTAHMRAARARRRQPLREHSIVATTDVDDAQQALSATYVPVRLHPQPGSSGVDTRLNAIAIERTTVGYLRLGTDIRVVADEITNYHVNVALIGKSRSRSGGGDEVLTVPGTAVVFTPGKPAEVSWTGDTEQMCLMFDPDDIERELIDLLGRELTDPLTFTESMDLRGPAGRAWMQTLHLIDSAAESDAQLLRYRLTVRRLEQILIDGLLLGNQHNYSAQLNAEPATPGQRATRRALELLNSRPEHPWTSRELAAAVAISAQSLQTGFRGLTGTSPMAYLRSVRLERAHQDLTMADPQHTTVSHIAHTWGFLHLGRFSSAYQQRYGRRPSQTLRNQG